MEWLRTDRSKAQESPIRVGLVLSSAGIVKLSWACPGSVDGYGLGSQALCCNCLLS